MKGRDGAGERDGPYEPSWESLDTHPVPEWYHDAKLGVFIHWGVYSVPAWAPTDADIGGENASPYAEWYPYYMYDEESPTFDYHREEYGADVEYADFIEEWDAAEWDPEEWADLFADVGAGYVVLTGEHHDGFPLWDTHYTKYNAAEMGPERDLVGDLATAVRDRDMRFGASYHANYNYYQPGFAGRFGHPDYAAGPLGSEESGPGPEYVDFMNAKHRELIREYDPDLLWFDTPNADSDHLRARELMADFYNRAAERGREVVVNDRAATDAVGGTIDPDEDGGETHGDFVTPEYATLDSLTERKWEACRGIGHSFGFNRAEDEDDHIDPGELVRTFVDVVSKNGNLLLNVGPQADGTIPDPQKRRLRALGEWLSVNGEAVFGTRPWVVAEDDHSDVEVRYTWREGALYATALAWPEEELTLGIPAQTGSIPDDAAVLSADGGRPCGTSTQRETVTVSLPDRPDHDYAYAVRFEGVDGPDR
ncbi:MAG: alpha-L-fucosidase [Haloarculaceae archaeon]